MPLLGFAQTRALLNKYSLPYVKAAYASDVETIMAHADSLGIKPPYVLKATGPTIKHKTERGLVNVGIHTKEELRHTLLKMQKEIAGEKGAGFLLQEMLTGAELIIGAKRDASFGPTVLFGTGGIYAELLDDVSVRPAPITHAEAMEMIMETKASKFLNGFRGMKADGNEIAKLLVNTSRLIDSEKEVRELDFNPVIATIGDGAVIVDARIVVQ